MRRSDRTCLKTLNTAGFHAELRFGEPRVYPHRRVAADETFAEIAAMRESAPIAMRREMLQPFSVVSQKLFA